MSAEELYKSLSQGEKLAPLRPPGKPLELQGHFSTVLLSALTRLDRSDAAVMEHFAHVLPDMAVLYDGFPKSKVHLLVMPRERIMSVRDLTPAQLPLLRRIAAYTTWIIEGLMAQFPQLTWRQGVHANPSLKQLHVHVISQDFRSPCLKNKKHYNSFQPPFLVGLDSLISSLEAGKGALGSVTEAEAEAWLKRDLRCSASGVEFGSRFAELKRHLEKCPVEPSMPLPSLWRGADAEQAASEECAEAASKRPRTVIELDD